MSTVKWIRIPIGFTISLVVITVVISYLRELEHTNFKLNNRVQHLESENDSLKTIYMHTISLHRDHLREECMWLNK